MQNDANGSEPLDSTISLLEALTTTNLLLAQIAQDIGVIVGVIRSATVEPVADEDDDLPENTPFRDRLVAAGVWRVDDIPLAIADIKRAIGLSDEEAVELATYRDRALKARRQMYEQ